MIGTKLGAYEITEEIGKGGMATVYRAYQPNMDRYVAVKVISARMLSDEVMKERFQREAKLIAKLEHPHLLPIFDFNGTHAPPYIAMRFLEGGTLKQVMEVGKLPKEEVLYTLRQISSALDYAHRQGVVHRDLKPSNIMVDKEGNSFVGDFGIAHVSGANKELTGSGMVMGTPGYMAPEQANAESEIDQRADVYSLGVIIYEMLAGKPPFEGESPISIMMSHLSDPVPNITDDNPDLPEAVNEVLQTALAKDKKDRYQTTGELVESLAKALDTETIDNPAKLRDMTGSFAASQLAALQEQAKKTKTPSDQQRQMTALYIDVTDFAEMLYENEEPDAARTIVDALWQEIEKVAEKYGGVIDARSGEGGMILWGREETKESDPEQAIRAGLEMQAVITEVTIARFGESEEAPPFKAGITTGPVLLTRDDDTGSFNASGATMTLATRLKESAPPGTVLLSHDTFAHVRGIFALEELPPVRLRGRKEPLGVYVVLSEMPRAVRKKSRGIEGVETKMIGREPELKILQDALTLVMEDQETQVITVVGEAGVGKSRLLYEFNNWIDLHEQRFWYFEARATQPSMLQPYSLTRDLFSSRFEIADNDPLPVVREKFEKGIEGFLGEGNKEKAHLIGQLVGFDFSDSPTVEAVLKDPESFQKLALKHLGELFIVAADTEPVTIRVEDIHWADERSLDLLNNLARENPNIALFIINMARPEMYDRRPSWGEGQEFHARINLQPLSRLDSRRLVRELLKKIDKVPTELRDLIIKRMEGNPFYAEELVKVLIDDGVIVKGEPNWTVDMSKLTKVRVPPTLTGVVQARLDRLPAGEQFMLQRASVVGRLFWESAAAHLSADDGLTAGAVGDMLEDLRQREMVFKREDSAFEGTNEYIFRHAILRHVVYENIVPRQRRKYHKLVAEWLENAGEDRMDEYRLLIAEHYEAAGDAPLAAKQLLDAGTSIRLLGTVDESISVFEKGLAMLDEKKHEAERLPIQMQIGAVLALKGDYVGARAQFEPGLTTARKLKDRESEAKALSELG
ncbi:MAG: protein kinase, partial [Chloroflexi bacterium]|nr:protein kinase [Chloroflexota bacterium]